MKRCSSCKRDKPKSEFYCDGRAKDGLYSRCKACSIVSTRKWQIENSTRHRETMKAWRNNNPERVRANGKHWDVENRDRRRELNDRWRKNNLKKYRESVRRSEVRRRKENPEKVACRIRTNRAIRDGLLKRQRCSVCGTDKQIEAHHADYSKPLAVQWLCRKHHVELHINKNKGVAR